MIWGMHVASSSFRQQSLAYDPLVDDIGYMTCMTMVLLGNYAHTRASRWTDRKHTVQRCGAFDRS